MESVVVQEPAAPGGAVPSSWSLGPGESLTFGRGVPGAAVDVVLDHPAVSRVAGRIDALEDFWLLTHLGGGEIPYVVENPEGGGEFLKVRPGRSRAPIPFEFSRLLLGPDDDAAELLVLAPEHDLSATAAAPEGAATRHALSLDREAKYFRVLVALCEPRLRDPAATAVPSLPALQERLGPTLDLSRSAVNFHLDYLARHKLRVVDDDAPPGEGDRAEDRRQALAAVALRFDLVRADDLALLDG